MFIPRAPLVTLNFLPRSVSRARHGGSERFPPGNLPARCDLPARREVLEGGSDAPCDSRLEAYSVVVGGGCVGVPVGWLGVRVGGGPAGSSAAGPRGVRAGWTVPAFAHQTVAWVLS